ncbi:MAG: LPP20 family lipoprotein [Chitinispirillales bacterium]|nr:LPP20 family lipoprotein [Chitinispirillales bacterium]
MKHARGIVHAVLIAAVLLLPLFVYSQSQQGAPSWINEGPRQMQYPSAEWYVGFDMDVIGHGANIADALRNVTNRARSDLAGQITVNIKSETVLNTRSDRVTQTDGRSQETLQREYGQFITTSTDTEVGNMEVFTYHDQANNTVYALAVVKKSDLAAYYQSRINYYQQNADNAFKLAQQLAGEGRRRSAMERLDEIPAHLNGCGRYITLLSAVVDNVSSQQNRATALVSQIIAFEAKLQESFTVYFTGTETIDRSEVDIVIPGLQHKFTEQGCRVATNRATAGYVLTVNVNTCNVTSDRNFTYCQACVRADLVNTQTGRSEAKINFNAPREGWTNQERACRRAMEKSVDAIWERISNNTEICR